MTVAELQALAPNLEWVRYFQALGVPTLAKAEGSLNVAVPKFARQVSALLVATPVETWRAYLRYHRGTSGGSVSHACWQRGEFQVTLAGLTPGGTPERVLCLPDPL